MLVLLLEKNKSKEKVAEILLAVIPAKLVSDSNLQRSVMIVMRYRKKCVPKTFAKLSGKHMRWDSFDITYFGLIFLFLCSLGTSENLWLF